MARAQANEFGEYEGWRFISPRRKQTRNSADPPAGEVVREPPRPPFTLCVGVTGHRADMLPAGSLRLAARAHPRGPAADRGGGRAASAAERDVLRGSADRALRFVSPIADGADQIAAEVALELGWELQAMLPFDRARYRASLANRRRARALRRAARASAACVLELPGDREREPRRLCDDRPRDRCALRHPDRDLGRASAARTRRHRRGRPAGHDARHGDHPLPPAPGGERASAVERVRSHGRDRCRRSRRSSARSTGPTSTRC